MESAHEKLASKRVTLNIFVDTIVVSVARAVQPPSGVQYQQLGIVWVTVRRTQLKVPVLPIGPAERREFQVAAIAKRAPHDIARKAFKACDNVVVSVDLPVIVAVSEYQHA